MAPWKQEAHQALTRTLSQKVPALSADALQAFVAPYLDRRHTFLDAAERHGSPLYLLDKPALEAAAVRFKAAFEQVLPEVGFYYAVKSNNHPEVARTLVSHGLGLDVSSGLELETALQLGVRDAVFSGPGKTDAELDLAARHAGRVTVLLDSPGELHRLEAAAAAQAAAVRCGVRLTVNPNGLWRKFGIALESLADFWAMARRCPHIELAGLQFHTSWNLTPEPQIAFIQRLGKALAALPNAFIEAIDFIDIGGGYWPGQGEWLHDAATSAGRVRDALGLAAATGPSREHRCLSAEPIESFARQLAEALCENIFNVKPCRICVEPGRWISHASMHMLITVVDKKASDLVITDAGTNAVGWERYESDFFPVLNLSRPSLQEHPCHILGSLCTPHDVWGYFYFGTAVEPGDVLMIPTQGAYTYSLRQNFIKPLPEVVVLQ
jgi:diaminopimelate decarboxylase